MEGVVANLRSSRFLEKVSWEVAPSDTQSPWSHGFPKLGGRHFPGDVFQEAPSAQICYDAANCRCACVQKEHALCANLCLATLACPVRTPFSLRPSELEPQLPRAYGSPSDHLPTEENRLLFRKPPTPLLASGAHIVMPVYKS